MKEEWKYIKGFDDKYLISNKGYVKSIERKIGRGKGYIKKEQILKFTYDKDKYKMVSITCPEKKNRAIRIHVIVATHFLGKKPSEKSVVCHKNDDKTNNEASNLYWGDIISNTLDRYKNNKTKFSEIQIIEMRKMYEKGIKQKEIASKFGCTQNYVSRVVNRKRCVYID